MTNRGFLAAAMAGLLLGGTMNADELGKRASWDPATVSAVKSAVDAWLETENLDANQRFTVETIWPAEGAPANVDLLDRVATTIAIIEKGDVRGMVDFCRKGSDKPIARRFDFLQDEKLHPFVRNNMRLYYGRWLVQNELYDESVEHLSGLNAKDVVDPASLLFFQSVGFHRLLKKEDCLKSLGTLMENKNAIPRRYATVASLMSADIQPLKTDSLDEISRMMDDIYRRQRLYRAGTRVRTEEEDVIAKLSKIIKELEEKRKKKNGPGGLYPSQPMQDSKIGGGSGAGNVDREAAMAELVNDLPAHYRDVIEQYFRKLARDEPR